MRLAQADQMQDIDRTAIEKIGIPGVVLMENAGKETARLMVQHFGAPAGQKAVVFAGPGNNGGDGFVVARHLQQMGAMVEVCQLVAADRIHGDAAVNRDIALKLAIPIRLAQTSDDVAEVELADCWCVVDALFGTGLKRDVAGHFAEAVRRINNAPCPVVAVDMPSGLDSDGGKILGEAVQADLTLTYGVAKPGQFIFPGRQLVGRLHVIDIGIPSQVIAGAGLHCQLLDRESMRKLYHGRDNNSHKGTYGHLLVVAGSTGKSGAAILSGLGALRTGVGLVSLCISRQLNTIVESALFEAMTIPVAGEESGAPAVNDYEQIAADLKTKQAVVMGPGLGTSAGTAQLVKRLYATVDLPMVVDADGLNILAAESNLLQNNSDAVRILTPHPGEMGRILGKTSKEIQQNRLAVAKECAVKHNVYLVLKGAGTIIAAPDGSLAINSTGNAGMAAGGMGDVLSGIIGGLLAQGMKPWQACCLAVFLHGRAADILAGEEPHGYLAAEVADMIPAVFKELL